MKKHTWISRAVSFILCLVLAAATALSATGCNTPTTPPTADGSAVQATAVGEGQTAFLFTVTDLDGVSTAFEVHTDKETVGQALMDVGLLEGEDGPYGLYVKAVNGIPLDYDTDGAYWAFYVGGEYAMSGVDTTPIEANTAYEMRAEKA